MPRYKLTIEYDGAPFVGWQVQGVGLGRSVQGCLTAAFQKFCGEEVKVSGAGRTDAGVHATGQVAHVDLARDWRADVVRDAVNAHLRPHPIAILKAERVADDFEARFSAIRRAYCYRIIDRRAPLTLQRHSAWWVPRRLDVAAMHDAAQILVGRHDFTTFRATECQAKSPVKTVESVDVLRVGEVIEVHAVARSFLHNQVRSMVGSLKHVGEGYWPKERLAQALEARDRRACGTVAPPEGLCLVRVDYPPVDGELIAK
ncbi:MAG: tRNA pseudouridine(38-40) synthase TruA [Alphaproteobacteria bacterium]